MHRTFISNKEEMIMKMKKLTALLLAGVMIMSAALTGCGSGDSGSGSEKDSGGKAGNARRSRRCSAAVRLQQNILY